METINESYTEPRGSFSMSSRPMLRRMSVENRNGLCVDLLVDYFTPATGYAERDEALEMLRRHRLRGYEPKTLGGDKGYYLGDSSQKVLEASSRASRCPTNGPAARLAAWATRSGHVIRKRVEIFSCDKSVAGLRRAMLKGRRNTWTAAT